MKEQRKTLQINESVYNAFNERKEASGSKNSSELLQDLLTQEMRKTVIVEKGMTFSNIEKRIEEGSD